MIRKFRQKIRRDKDAFVAALRKDVYGGQPEISISQLASILGESTASLYAALEGKRKFDPGLIGSLSELLGSTHTIEEQCGQAGGFYVPFPSGQDIQSRGLRDLAKHFQKKLDAILASKDPSGPGGQRCTPEEYEKIRDPGRKLQAVIEKILSEAAVEAETYSKSGNGAATMAEAAARADSK